MAQEPTRKQAEKSPARTTVRGFLNLAAAVPDFGAVPQREGAFAGASGGAGLLFGHGNYVPVVAMAAKQASPTAYRCIERRTQFLVGTGFAGEFGELPVPGHPGKTVNDAWAEFGSYGGDFNAAAVLVRYLGVEGGYGIGEIHILPFGAVRKTAKGTYLLNHKFGRKGFKSGDTTEHLPFNPDPKQVKREMTAARKLAAEKKKPYSQAGQIFYVYTPKAGEEDYPLPPTWPGIDALLTEAAYQNFDLTEVRRGFMAKGILTLIGKLNDTVKDENGMTQLERQDAELRRFTVQGALEEGEERESILVMDAATKEAAAIWTALNTTTDLKWLADKKEAVGQEICRHIGIPPILAGFAKAGQLGAVQELVNAAQLTQASLEPLRQLLVRAFWQLFPELKDQQPGKLDPVQVAAATASATPAT